jgi:hypothetical protein
MSENIYSDIWAEVLITEGEDKRVYIHQEGSLYTLALVLPNLLAVKNLRDYLDKIVKAKENKEYYRRIGE